MERVDRLNDESLVRKDTLQFLVLLQQNLHDGVQLVDLTRSALYVIIQLLVQRIVTRECNSLELLN